MAVARFSFLSNLSSLVPISSQSQSSPPPKFSTGKICCRKTEAVIENGDGSISRRDVLKSLGATISIVSSGSFIETAVAADLIQLRQRSDFLSKVKSTLYRNIKANPELIPSLLTLALNDAMTYHKATKSGGPNGSIRFSSELSRPENEGLSAALNFLEETKKEIDAYSKGGPISYADLIQYAAQSAVKNTFLSAAIRKAGGNEEKGNLLYTAYGSAGQWGLFDKTLGRSDTQEVDPEGRVPQWQKASVQEMKDKFIAVGFGPRQLAVMSAFLGPDQLATETLLASDPAVSPWVEKYQRSRESVSQTNYEVVAWGKKSTTKHTHIPSRKSISANSNCRKFQMYGDISRRAWELEHANLSFL